MVRHCTSYANGSCMGGSNINALYCCCYHDVEAWWVLILCDAISTVLKMTNGPVRAGPSGGLKVMGLALLVRRASLIAGRSN